MLLEAAGPSMYSPSAALGTVRVRATAVDPGRPVFVGVAPRADADRYLAGVASGTVVGDRSGTGPANDAPVVLEQPGGAPTVPPQEAGFWTASASGPGVQSVTWQPVPGDWTLVILQPDGRAGVDVAVDAGATVPGLRILALGLLVVGGVLVALGATTVTVAVATAQRRRRASTGPAA